MDIVDQIVERLRVCWCVLTMRNYFFFAFKGPEKLFVTKDDNWEIIGARREMTRSIYHVDGFGLVGNEKYKSLRDLLCEIVIRRTFKIKRGEL
jgi:hypothetical protein